MTSAEANSVFNQPVISHECCIAPSRKPRTKVVPGTLIKIMKTIDVFRSTNSNNVVSSIEHSQFLRHLPMCEVIDAESQSERSQVQILESSGALESEEVGE